VNHRRTSVIGPALCVPLLAFGALALAGCQPVPGAANGSESGAADASAEETRPGWQWTDEEVQATVDEVRAGRDLNPSSWPDGARVAALLSFDVDNETVTGLRYGDATVGSLSQGQYGARAALPRIVDLMDRHEIPASFFIPAVSMKMNPGMLDVIQASGRHEIAIHGWIHELNSSLEADVEERLLRRAVDYYTELLGEAPVGYRAPSWNFSPNTLDILRRMGFLYDSSLMADDRPYEIDANGEPTGLIELPVEWILDDAPLFNPRGNSYASPREVMQVWIDEFDKAWEEGTIFVLTMHPHVSGHRSRIVALEGLIEHIQSKPGVWWATHREAAEYVKAQAGME
jgi:peptidoglycan/xylan/chitin deacetylase (PgdA/CDA1 family)